MDKTLGEEIAKIRIEKGFTLRKLSEKLFLGENGHIILSDIECKRIIPNEDLLKKILTELSALDKFEYIYEILKKSETENNYTDDKEFELPIYFKNVKRIKV